jgi:hypothetical protein
VPGDISASFSSLHHGVSIAVSRGCETGRVRPPCRGRGGRPKQSPERHGADDRRGAASGAEHTRARSRGRTHWLGSLVVLTVTGVPRSEPWWPYGRIVSPERELQLLSTEPWRAAAVSFLVIVAGEARGSSRCASRSRAVLWWSGGCLRRRA